MLPFGYIYNFAENEKNTEVSESQLTTLAETSSMEREIICWSVFLVVLFVVGGGLACWCRCRYSKMKSKSVK